MTDDSDTLSSPGGFGKRNPGEPRPTPLQQPQAAAPEAMEPEFALDQEAENAPAAMEETPQPAPAMTQPSHETLPEADALIKPFEQSLPAEEPLETAPSRAPRETVKEIEGVKFRRLELDEEPTPAVQPTPSVAAENTPAPQPEFALHQDEPSVSMSATSETTAATSGPQPLEETPDEAEDTPRLEDEEEAEALLDDSEDLSDDEALALESLTEAELPKDEISEQTIEAIARENAGLTQAAAPVDPATDQDLPDVEPGALAGGGTADHSEENRQAIENLIKEHEVWIESDGANGRRALFKEVDLRGFDFSHKRLSGAVFRGKDLTHCRFVQTELVEADFSDATLEGANFMSAAMHRANFNQAKGAKVAFTGAQLANATLEHGQFEDCDFSQANLETVNLRDSRLTGSNFTQAIAMEASFRNAQMSKTDFTRAELANARFREANLSHAVLEGAVVTGTSFQNCDLTGVDLNSTDFSQATDVSSEVHARYMQEQREELKKQEQKFEHIRNELEQRERKLISEREELQRQLQKAKNAPAAPARSGPALGEIAGKVKKASKLFLIMGVCWFVLCFFLFIVLQGVFNQLDSGVLSFVEIFLMAILLIGPTIMFVLTMAKCFSLSHLLQSASGTVTTKKKEDS